MRARTLCFGEQVDGEAAVSIGLANTGCARRARDSLEKRPAIAQQGADADRRSHRRKWTGEVSF